jgi:hypothetical protein
LRDPQYSSVGDIKRALNVIEKYATPRRQLLMNRYDFGTVSAPVDSEGLTFRMKEEIDGLLKDGWVPLGKSENGYPTFQKGVVVKEVFPDAR